MRSRLAPLAVGLFLAPLGAVLAGQGASDTVRARPASVAASGETADSWGRRVEAMSRAGSLRLRSSVADTMLEGRVHDRFDQYVDGVRIFGAQVIRQRSAAGVESVFGTLFPEDLKVSTTPALSADDAVARVTAIAGRKPLAGRAPELVLLPREDGTLVLTWLTHVRVPGDIVSLFLDAQTGQEVRRITDLRRQAAVGTGTGVLGDRKKLATRQASGTFFADDTLRPPALLTYDMRGNYERALAILEGDIEAAQSDLAADTDNVWTEGAVVDGHAYVGFTYDYFYLRFNRRGLDDNNRRIRGLVNPARPIDALTIYNDLDVFFDNAGWCDVCGRDGQGYMYFGVGIPAGYVSFDGQQVANTAGAFDVVAHELAHAVTSYSSDLIYENESGALNEAFSDIMSVGAEYFLRATGRSDRTPDYLSGEDVWTPGDPGSQTGIRSMSNPAQFDQPDHYSRRYLGPGDNGGVHINSGIANHAFYLAIEGGTNRTSGLAVAGVGGSNREQIERIFYRGFTSYLTPNATFAQARQATLRAASELAGESSAAYRAVQQAWTAVGVN
jgi:Zn-dependent metalloprotease